jgi:exodeoxyribonuclease III
VVGDFNIAPTYLDVYDPAGWHEQIHCSSAERSALAEITALGLHDSLRLLDDRRIYSWWDYRKAAFAQNKGLRIDLALISEGLKAHLLRAGVDQQPRTWPQASDHAPVWLELSSS